MTVDLSLKDYSPRVFNYVAISDFYNSWWNPIAKKYPASGGIDMKVLNNFFTF